MTYEEARKEAEQILKGAEVPDAALDAWYLLEYYPETEQPYVVTLNGETGEVRSDSNQLNNLDDLRAVQHLLITPASLLPDDVDSDAVGQFITDASGVLVSGVYGEGKTTASGKLALRLIGEPRL